MIEIWKDIINYEGHYKISNYGNVKSVKKGKNKILKPQLHTEGYLYNKYSIERVKICMLKRSHDIPRLIVNRLNAYTTDTAYRIKMLKPEINPDLLAYSFINSLTALSAELEGRHYGGGVLELVPSEIEKLLIPISNKITPFVDELDAQIRTLKTEDILGLQDKNVLANVGLSTDEIITLQNAWCRLKNRRQRVEN